MKITILIIFLSLIVGIAWTQNLNYVEYKKFIESASKKAESINFELAFQKYDSAFLLIDYIPYDYYSAFKYAIQANDYSRALKYLVKGTTVGLEINKWFSGEVELFKESSYYAVFIVQKDSLTSVYKKSIDYDTFIKIEKLKKRDQEIRAIDSEQMRINDSLNINELIEITIQKGFPTFEKVGYGHNKAWLLLWHQRHKYPDSPEWKKIIPYISEEINEGKIDPDFFAPFDEYKNTSHNNAL